ncbi:MAG TPA: 5'-nucleotidase [Lachnospiraceae bacterium]|nr:5'-nucleotidase [Lachnospiraceae bacterium]
MAYSLENRLVIGVSTRALFDLHVENSIFEEKGVEAYSLYQKEHEGEVLRPGPGFRLMKALLQLNKLPGHENRVEVILMSKNSPDISLRIFHSIEYYGLEITRAVFLSGAPLAPYLSAFQTDLFLSACEQDVQSAIDAGIAAGIICGDGKEDNLLGDPSDIESNQIRIAFDGDAVLFSDEAEQVFQEKGLQAFESSEKEKAEMPLHAGPFARFLKTLSDLQKEFDADKAPIRTALVTARSAPAHERVIRTLRAWNVRIDEAFFLGGITKREVLSAFGAQIFFDDQLLHTRQASEVVPAARVPIKTGSPLNHYIFKLQNKIDDVS